MQLNYFSESYTITAAKLGENDVFGQKMKLISFKSDNIAVVIFDFFGHKKWFLKNIALMPSPKKISDPCFFPVYYVINDNLEPPRSPIGKFRDHHPEKKSGILKYSTLHSRTTVRSKRFLKKKKLKRRSFVFSFNPTIDHCRLKNSNAFEKFVYSFNQNASWKIRCEFLCEPLLVWTSSCGKSRFDLFFIYFLKRNISFCPGCFISKHIIFERIKFKGGLSSNW